MIRRCCLCAEPIAECMGGVVASDILTQLTTGAPIPKNTREVCGACALISSPEILSLQPKTFTVTVITFFKDGVPNGEREPLKRTLSHSSVSFLQEIGRVGKCFVIQLNAYNVSFARKMVIRMCDDLLTNSAIEEYRIIDAQEGEY